MFNNYPTLVNRANSTSLWLGSDSEANYIKNYSSVNSIYIGNPIEYKFNEYGFRCDSFNDTSELPILFVGCSLTEGVGVAVTDTWACKLLQRIRSHYQKHIPYWNIGFSGAGIDTNTSMLVDTIKIVKPKVIIMYVAPFQRRDLSLHSNEVLLCGPWTTENALLKLVSSDYFTEHQTRRSVTSIQLVQQICNANVFIASWDPSINGRCMFNNVIKDYPTLTNAGVTGDEIDKGRDHKHPGPLAHINIANFIWETVKLHL